MKKVFLMVVGLGAMSLAHGSVDTDLPSHPFRITVKDSLGHIVPNSQVAITYDNGKIFSQSITDQDGICVVNAPASNNVFVIVNGVSSAHFYSPPQTPDGFNETPINVPVVYFGKEHGMEIHSRLFTNKRFLVIVKTGPNQGLIEKIQADAKGNLLIPGKNFSHGKLQENDSLQVRLLGSNLAWSIDYKAGRRFELNTSARSL